MGGTDAEVVESGPSTARDRVRDELSRKNTRLAKAKRSAKVQSCEMEGRKNERDADDRLAHQAGQSSLRTSCLHEGMQCSGRPPAIWSAIHRSVAIAIGLW